MARKLGRRTFGPYRLLSVKEPGGPWEGLLWMKAKSKAQITEMSDEEFEESKIAACPFGVPGMCFPSDGYPLVRSECKRLAEDHELFGEDGNCVFLFRYANTLGYNCRLLERTDKEQVYEEEW